MATHLARATARTASSLWRWRSPLAASSWTRSTPACSVQTRFISDEATAAASTAASTAPEALGQEEAPPRDLGELLQSQDVDQYASFLERFNPTQMSSPRSADNVQNLRRQFMDEMLGFVNADPQSPPRMHTVYFKKISFKMDAWDYAVLDSYTEFIRRAAIELGIEVSGRVPLPTHIHRITILSSPHVYKKHREQYEMRTHKRLIEIRKVTGETADHFCSYVMENIPPGVSLRIKHVTAEPFEEQEHLVDDLRQRPERARRNLVRQARRRSKKRSDIMGNDLNRSMLMQNIMVDNIAGPITIPDSPLYYGDDAPLGTMSVSKESAPGRFVDVTEDDVRRSPELLGLSRADVDDMDALISKFGEENGTEGNQDASSSDAADSNGDNTAEDSNKKDDDNQ